MSSRPPRSGTSLGTWIKHRRQDYALGRLNPDWARQLEALPGWTWGQEEGRHVRPKSRADFSESNSPIWGMANAVVPRRVVWCAHGGSTWDACDKTGLPIRFRSLHAQPAQGLREQVRQAPDAQVHLHGPEHRHLVHGQVTFSSSLCRHASLCNGGPSLQLRTACSLSPPQPARAHSPHLCHPSTRPRLRSAPHPPPALCLQEARVQEGQALRIPRRGPGERAGVVVGEEGQAGEQRRAAPQAAAPPQHGPAPAPGGPRGWHLQPREPGSGAGGECKAGRHRPGAGGAHGGGGAPACRGPLLTHGPHADRRREPCRKGPSRER